MLKRMAMLASGALMVTVNACGGETLSTTGQEERVHSNPAAKIRGREGQCISGSRTRGR